MIPSTLDTSNLVDRARYGDTRGVEAIADTPEVKLVLFSLQRGQEAKGRGEPRVHMLVLEGAGVLWNERGEVPASTGTLLASEPGEAHGARAGEGRLLVLGVITPRP
jgi:quercetin dioxygenase-like cupin family protein